MNFTFLNNDKAAFKHVAFLIYLGLVFFSNIKSHASLKDQVVASSPATLKQKTMELLLQKKKKQAIDGILSYLNYNDKKNFDEVSELLVMVARQFVYRDSQEAYENSINLTIDNINEAIKSNEKCLTLEPQQLECLIQKIRLHFRSKNDKGITETILKIKEIVPQSQYEKWLSLILIKTKAEFKNKQILKVYGLKKQDEWNGLVLLELERCFIVKNYSCAKDLLNYYEKHYPDWPDLLFFKYKLDEESAEERFGFHNEKNAEQLVLYKNKCKVLNKTIARKYRYDFELCIREPRQK